jgi:hypothetical protein
MPRISYEVLGVTVSRENFPQEYRLAAILSILRARQLRVAIRPSDQVLRAIVKRGIHGLLWRLRVHIHHKRDAKGEDRNEYVEHY